MRLLAALLGITLSAVAQDAFYPFSIDQDHLTGAPDFSARSVSAMRSWIATNSSSE